MQAELAAEFPIVEQTYKEASDAIDVDLWKLVQDGPAEILGETINTQPVMLTAGVATWRAWQACGGPDPAQLSGHSLGEYSALVCAGALDFAAAAKLVRRRGELMQNAIPAEEGAMAAIIGLDDEAVVRVCAEASSAGIAEAVNFNSPGQVVVAGQKAAVDKAIALASDSGARRAILLPVSVPSHSSLMEPACELLADVLSAADFTTPSITVLSAVDASPYADPDDIRTRLATQIAKPVRWVNVVETMRGNGASTILECGPGRVLTGLAKRIDRALTSACIDAPGSLRKSLDGVNV